ncbi:MBL fold metallo-hydrolase [Verrucomicrobia bacterium LW23]|nr:MBL fold metallo-hydrolase [Verrucomicrobia bacterium LW23]
MHVPEPLLHPLPQDVAFAVTVLGSGTSQGVPMVGCTCPVCVSDDPRDKRTRSSIYVQSPGIRILVDTTPELRLQACRERVAVVDVVLFTHAHADHVMGFDDLRRFCEMASRPMPIYGTVETVASLQRCFPWAFTANPEFFTYVNVRPHVIEPQVPFILGDMRITPVSLPHGRMGSLGFIFERADVENGPRLTYMSDCKSIPEPAMTAAFRSDVLIVDGLRDKPHPTHMCVADALEAGRTMQAGEVYLTHLTHEKKHVDRAAELPPGNAPAYDGLRLEMRKSLQPKD